jgi:hypothetical protein
MSYGNDRTVVPVTIDIAVSTTISAEANVNGKRIVGVIMPTAWTGAGNLTLTALTDEPSANPKVPVFSNIVDDAGAAAGVIGTAVAAGLYIALPAAKQYVGLGRVKITATVAQGANRVIKLVCLDF